MRAIGQGFGYLQVGPFCSTANELNLAELNFVLEWFQKNVFVKLQGDASLAQEQHSQ